MKHKLLDLDFSEGIAWNNFTVGFTILTGIYVVTNDVLNLIKISLFFLNRNIKVLDIYY